MRVPVNKAKAILSAATFVFFGGYGIYYVIQSLWFAAIVFLTIAALFGIVFYHSTSTVHINDSRIRLAFFGRKRREILWRDVREMGLIGENVFRRCQGSKTGNKYIYFSPTEMTPDERFDRIVRWPPRDMIYCEYSEKALAYSMSIWKKKLETYNVEDLYANSWERK